MELSERKDIEKIVLETLGRRWKYRDCPKCGEWSGMLKFEVKVWRNDPPKDESDYDLIDRLRCIGCLSVYEDILQEVKSE